VIVQLIAAVAIVGGTVHTGRGPALEGATVLIESNRVADVGTGVAIPATAERIDATGMVVTPGLIEAHARLGVAEFSRNVPSAVEATAGPGYDPVRAALRVFDTFNVRSPTIPVARGGGITSAVVVPVGGVISGQSIWVDLVAERPVRKRALALHVSLIGRGDVPGGRSRAYLRLREALEDARLYRANRGPYISGKLRDLSVSAADLDALERALEGELRVSIEVDRASDIRSVLRLVRQHRLDAVLVGAAEGWQVADEIARADVPVLIDPLQNLPSSYDTLESRSDNALLLQRAGVRVGFTTRADPHLAHRLRYAAGNAVAEGLPYEHAISAITRVPAEAFGIADAGTLRQGALANVVIWNGDPLEVTSWPTHMWIRGVRVPLRSRQDLLTERYR
jgi:imidazolonepropionase-like amidohydrolase